MHSEGVLLSFWKEMLITTLHNNKLGPLAVLTAQKMHLVIKSEEENRERVQMSSSEKNVSTKRTLGWPA